MTLFPYTTLFRSFRVSLRSCFFPHLYLESEPVQTSNAVRSSLIEKESLELTWDRPPLMESCRYEAQNLIPFSHIWFDPWWEVDGNRIRDDIEGRNRFDSKLRCFSLAWGCFWHFRNCWGHCEIIESMWVCNREFDILWGLLVQFDRNFCLIALVAPIVLWFSNLNPNVSYITNWPQKICFKFWKLQKGPRTYCRFWKLDLGPTNFCYKF